jgi:uncharacterized protein (DUF302 family)
LAIYVWARPKKIGFQVGGTFLVLVCTSGFQQEIKMKPIIFAVLLITCIAVPAGADDGLVTVASSFSVTETADRLERVLQEKSMTVFNRIKHSQSAAAVGIELRDTELIVFGNPKVGSPLMKCQQRVAIDLPQKALIWQDDAGRVWLTYNSPQYLVKRHQISGCDAVISKIDQALSGFAKAATTR